MASTILFLSASAIFLVAFWMYNKGFILGKNIPAFTGWGLFSLITLVTCFTYLGVTSKFLTITLFLTDFIVCVGTAGIILAKTKGRVRIDATDKKIALLSVIAIVVWVVFRTATGGNLINLVPYTLAFVSVYRNVLDNPRNEPTLPWALDALAFVLNIVALWIQPNVRMIDFVNPAVCFVHHAAIAALSMRKLNLVQEAP